MADPLTFKSGKFAGKAITDPAVPDSYLEYLLKLASLKPHLVKAIRAELDRRIAKPVEPEQAGIRVYSGRVDSSAVADIVSAIVAALKKRGEF